MPFGISPSRIKSFQYILIFLGFGGILLTGVLFKLKPQYELPFFSNPVPANQLALAMLTLSVLAYFLGRMLGFVLKYQKDK